MGLDPQVPGRRGGCHALRGHTTELLTHRAVRTPHPVLGAPGPRLLACLLCSHSKPATQDCDESLCRVKLLFFQPSAKPPYVNICLNLRVSYFHLDPFRRGVGSRRSPGLQGLSLGSGPGPASCAGGRGRSVCPDPAPWGRAVTPGGMTRGPLGSDGFQ